MSKVYNKAFKVGFAFNIFLFIIFNFISFAVSYDEYESGIQFDHGGYSWGFPFEMYRYYLGYPNNDIGFTGDGVIVNTFIITGCGFVVGFLLKSFWKDEFESHSIE